ncbi:hypothetical protein [Hugenholtzia roseola]|uniref:hypothetical protein n=1 Tax=Hugenholtzia roseola TaxID=1002 RepID=UPI001B7F91B1|nr:hypothetical protein [Hugenholtzia roseola]
MKICKTLFLFLSLAISLLLTQTLSAQNTEPIVAWQPTWTLAQENEHVRIFYKSADCYTASYGVQMEKLLFKVENKTGETLFLQFDLEKAYSHTENREMASEKEVRLVLSPKAALEGVCYPNTEAETSLSIFLANSAIPNMAKLEKININGLKTQLLK